MARNYTRYFALIWVAIMLTTIVNGQGSSFRQLEQKVYQLNNELKYNQSQALLLPVLQDNSFNADDKYQAAILLSYTYKRVFDYQSTLKFLGVAQKFAQETKNKSQYIANIRSEEAFVLFDTHAYQKADSLMSLLQRSGFKHIDLENKSKLVMQQGYLLFINKQYAKAEATYDKAIKWMQASAPCHLPMIFVKKMQLYNAMNRLDLLNDALKKSTAYADSCKIIKYHLYTYEELRNIYKERKDLAKTAQIQKQLDSLNKIYATEQNISSLHNQKENILVDYSNQKLQHEQISKTYLAMILAGLVILTLALLGWLLDYRRRQRQVESEFYRMKGELETYLAINKSGYLNQTPSAIGQQSELSGRQQEVLQYMSLGMSNKAIADKLFISENTVKYHIKNIYLLLEIKDRKEFLVKVKK